ncbi:tRNA (cytosine(38)-C(5))-methyltransferase-like [Lingula anatina]|uniref:tRNA (cytosine(38)-C(5))-methyltransferase n=1 Tax=Lingula anatina TaxID=7574 RepID=A0A2R2MLD7_LINAN|nr:tRNA (cytosine(38)-C(5))-methyltransferase-like [Lingula anatina]|eukprot:XP_023930877.1 tRNA (cytosine(38)-C(5))-methyltransferase-like [Lingula anatina]
MTHMKPSGPDDHMVCCYCQNPIKKSDILASSADTQKNEQTGNNLTDFDKINDTEDSTNEEPKAKAPRLDSGTVNSGNSIEHKDGGNITASKRQSCKKCTLSAGVIASNQDYSPQFCQSIDHYLEKQPEEYLEKFLLPEKDLKRFKVMDIVLPSSRKSCCFTKRYGHYMEGAGSMLQMVWGEEVNTSILKDDMIPEKAIEYMDDIKKLKLRYFTPREIANLMCFPKEFEFPNKLSRKQCYRVLGNSLNVHVVAVLIKLMTMNGVQQNDS